MSGGIRNLSLKDKKEDTKKICLNEVRYYLRKHFITEQVLLTVIVP